MHIECVINCKKINFGVDTVELLCPFFHSTRTSDVDFQKKEFDGPADYIHCLSNSIISISMLFPWYCCELFYNIFSTSIFMPQTCPRIVRLTAWIPNEDNRIVLGLVYSAMESNHPTVALFETLETVL